MSLLKLLLYYIPYYIFKRESSKNGVLVFAKIVLLTLANLVTVTIAYCWVTGVSIDAPQLTRGGTKLVGLLAMIPFALFYWMNKETYRRLFDEFEQLDRQASAKYDSYSRMYIYGTIGVLVVLIVCSFWSKFSGEQ